MPFHKRFVRDLYELPADVVDVAHEEGRAAVAVHAVHVDGDVAVHDVAVERAARSSGMPWQMTSFTDVHSDFG